MSDVAKGGGYTGAGGGKSVYLPLNFIVNQKLLKKIVMEPGWHGSEVEHNL